MINIKAVGLYSSDFSSGETRLGDAQVITDGTYFEVIDGYCDRGATRLIADLKSRSIKRPYLHISHAHYDHRDGIDKILSDSYFSPRGLYCQDPNSITGHNASIRSDIDALKRIIQKAKNKGVPVIYLTNEQKVQHGDIKFTVYRQYPKYTGNSDAYLNDGSLCYWFPELRYLTTGDASMWCAYKYGLNPLIVKGGHHGNDMSADGYLKPSQMCVWLYNKGCRFYWDNDFSTRLTDFLMTGRDDAINAGMTILDIHGDIVMTFASGKVTIKHGSKTYTASVPYKGGGMTGSWEKGSKGWWYKYADGSYAKGWTQIKYNGTLKWFLFDEDGWMQTGWKKDNGKWYFLDYKTGAMKIGWHKLPYGDGKEGWYLLGKDGAMLTGWQYSNKDGKAGWYYFDPTTGAMKTGWLYDGGDWYYLGSDGRMVTGWITYKGKRCYLEPKSDTTHKQGRCYVNTTAVIDGKTYRFDKDGYAEEVKKNDIDRSKKFIDISEHQGDVNWSKAVYSVGCVYIRCGLRGSLAKTAPQDYKKIRYDKKWARNLAEVMKYGVPFGAYYFPTAITTEEAVEGAKWFYGVVKDLPMSVPPVLDSENVWGNNKEAGRANSLSKSERTRLLKIVTDYFNERGMNIGIYASASWLNSKIDMSAFPQRVRDCTWVADSTGAVDYKGYYWLHQYGKGACAGFNGDVDLNKITGNIPPVKIGGTSVKETPIDVAIAIADSYVGTHEGANNKTIFGDTMHKIQPSNMDANAPWCDSFVDFVILKTCQHFGKGAETARNVLCGDFDDYTYNSVALYKKAGRWSSTPHRGDQIFFGGSGHTGMVESVESGTIHTIEGNKGDEVRRCSYIKSTPSIIGYGRPRYDLITGQITANDMPLVKRGSSGSAVKKLQQILNSKGYKLSEDGSFGAATESAVKAYQKANGLEVDGECGPNTWSSLFA